VVVRRGCEHSRGVPVAQTVVIVGASVRAAAQSAIRAGFVPWAADLFADADLCAVACARRITDYPEGLVAAAASAPFGPWMYTGALENRPDLVQRLSARRSLWGNSAEVLRKVRDPWRVRQALVACGILCPQLARSWAGLPADGSWLRKPLAGSGGVGIVAWRGEGQGPRARLRRPEGGSQNENPFGDASGALYFQKRICGKPCSAVFIGAKGRAVLLGITRQLVGTRWAHAKPFRYAGSVGPWLLRKPLGVQLERIGQALAQEFRLVGVFGVDAVVAAGRVWPVEVNPRWTASIEVLERACGLPVFAWHAAACSKGELPDWHYSRLRRHAQAGKAILFAPHELWVTEAFARWARPLWARREWPALADVPAAGTHIRPGRPVLTLLAQASSQAAVLHDLARGMAEVEGRLTARQACSSAVRKRRSAPRER